MLADAVGARSKAVEFIVALLIGERRGDDAAVRVEQIDLDASQRNVLLRLVDTVAIGVIPDFAAEARREDLAEIVVDAAGAWAENDIREQIGAAVLADSHAADSA